MRREKPILYRNVEPSINNRQSFKKENRTPKQSKLDNSLPSSVTHQRALIDPVDETNKVVPFSNEFSTFERDVEHLIAELDSKTKNRAKFQRKQQSSPGKVLQFKLNDSKLVSSSGSQITLSNHNGFVDAITVQIKLNKEQLMNEFAHGAMKNPQQPQEENTTMKAGKETPLTSNEHYTPERLKELALQRLNQQRNETSVPFLFEKQDISDDVCKQTNNFSTEFTQKRGIATQRWITDLLKGGLKNNDEDKVTDRGRNLRQSGESNSLAASPNRALHEPSIRPVLPLVRKQNISNPKTTPKITLNQSAENEHSRKDILETECSAKNASCGSKGQQRRAERDVRIALWQAKNAYLGETLKERNIRDGLVEKVRDTNLISSS